MTKDSPGMREKAKNAINESRVLMLGAEILLGFQYRAVFEQDFQKLPLSSQYLKLAGLILMLLAIALLLWPTAFHRIVEEGKITRDLNDFVTTAVCPALLPFGLGIAVDFYIYGDKLLNSTFGLACGIVALVVSLFFWYGLEMLARRMRPAGTSERKRGQGDEMTDEKTPLRDKIEFALIETRVVLPGAQALLGFQFAAMLMGGFDRLEPAMKYLHLASLVFIALCTIFLMAPAAYHRIVEDGGDSESMHRFTSRMILAAMAALALGLAGDVIVVFEKVLHSMQWSVVAGALTLIGFYALWFGYTLYRKAARHEPAHQTAAITR